MIPLLGEMGVAQKGCRRAKVAPTNKLLTLNSKLLTLQKSCQRFRQQLTVNCQLTFTYQECPRR